MTEELAHLIEALREDGHDQQQVVAEAIALLPSLLHFATFWDSEAELERRGNSYE